MYNIAICEIFHPILHGQDENSSPGIESNYLVAETFTLEEFYNNEYQETLDAMREHYNEQASNLGDHPIIRNYNSLLKKQNFIRIDIIYKDELTGQEMVGYLKTFWIKLIQRRWKKIYKQRQDLIKQRSLPKALREKQLTGQWPKGLRLWPKGFVNKMKLKGN